MRAFGMLLYVVGALGVLLVDVASSIWLYANHGLGWVIVSWVFVMPLLVIPFLAGLGLWFVIFAGAAMAGMALAEG